jgi:hypothetical protein
MVERSLSMREVPGSIPGASMINFFEKKFQTGPQICSLSLLQTWLTWGA